MTPREASVARAPACRRTGRPCPPHRPTGAAGRQGIPVPKGTPSPGIPWFYPGWFVVAGAFLTVMVGFGATYSYAAYAEEIGAEFGSSRSFVALAYALSGGACFFVGPLSGALADRVGPRVEVATGMLLVGAGLIVAAGARSMIGVLAGYGLLIGLGVGFAYVPAVATVQRWFVRRRGLASGIAISGIGVGTALVPPLSEALALLGGWRTAFVVSGVAATVLGLLGALLLDPCPERRGLSPDGGRRLAADPIARPAAPGRTWRWQDLAVAYLGTLLVSVPVSLPFAHLVPTARDLGLSRGEAVGLLGLIGLGSIAGRFLLAALADAIGRRRTFLGCCLGLAAATLLWAGAEGAAMLQAFALAFGALQGGFVALLPAFFTDRFGSRSVGALLGMLYTGRGIALLAAPPALALCVAELGGAHALPVTAVAALGVLGALLLALLDEGRDGAS